MSRDGNYKPSDIGVFMLFVVVAVLIGIGAYQIGFNLSGGREGGAEMGAVTTEAPVNGRSLYASNCAGCHGSQGEGGMGPALAASVAWKNEEFANAVLEGKTSQKELSPVMPRFASIGLDGEAATAEQMKSIQEYLASLKSK